MSHSMTRRQLLVAGTALSCLASGPAMRRAFAAPTRAAKVQEAVQQVTRAAVDSGDIPGVIAEVWQKGELIADATAGWLDIERKVAMDRNAILAIASMTKPVTVALALRLVDEGKLNLSDPITRWVPELSDMRVLRTPTSPLDDTVPAARAITVEDLMTHRSGLAYGFMVAPPLGTALLAKVGYGIESDKTPEAWLKALAEIPLLFQPGERFNYGHSLDVLGFVAARAASTDLHTAAREQLFAPLGMVDTGFWVPPGKRDRLAPFYYSPQPGQFMTSRIGAFTSEEPMAFASGGQGLLSTASDYLRFAQMLLHDGQLDGVRVLRSETVKRMRSNQFNEAQRKFPFVAGAPFTQGFGLGMSVVIDEKIPGVVTGGIGTFGWPGAFGGWWQADPKQELILVWLQQCTPAPPQPGAPMPRLPGAVAAQQFRQSVYSALNA